MTLVQGLSVNCLQTLGNRRGHTGEVLKGKVINDISIVAKTSVCCCDD